MYQIVGFDVIKIVNFICEMAKLYICEKVFCIMLPYDFMPTDSIIHSLQSQLSPRPLTHYP